VIEASYFEHLTTADIAAFISGQVQSRELAPKTANRYRDILWRLSTGRWNTRRAHARREEPRREGRALQGASVRVQSLTLAQIDEQLAALADKPQLQMMVATLIYAGRCREALLWLTLVDLDLATGPFGMIPVRAKTSVGRAGSRRRR
jgi:hypothetical protein